MQLPKSILKDPKIKKLYEDFKKQQVGKGKMKGYGIWEDFNSFLKRSKIISNVSGVVLPWATGALGGTIGTALGGPAGTATGAAVGAAVGKSGSDYLKSLGYGRMRGGDSRLVINPNGQRLGQRRMKGGAMTYGITGVYQQVPKTLAGTQIGLAQKGGQTSAFGSISSQFGNIKTR